MRRQNGIQGCLFNQKGVRTEVRQRAGRQRGESPGGGQAGRRAGESKCESWRMRAGAGGGSHSGTTVAEGSRS